MKSIRVYNYKKSEWNSQQWDERYKALDLVKDQNGRSLLAYTSFIDDAFEKLGFDKRRDLRIVEMGCGSGPLGKHLLEKGYNVEFSDYSKVIVERLKNELGYNAFVADCRSLSAIADNTYDVILLAGTVYEFDNYFTAARIYSEFSRILKPQGTLIHFYNTYRNVYFGIRYSYFSQMLFRCVHPLVFLKERNVIRKLFGKPPVALHTHNWLYDADEIKDMLSVNHFSIKKFEMLGTQGGIWQCFPFLRRNPKRYAVTSCDREEVLKRPGIHLAKFFEKRWPNFFSHFLGIMAENNK